METIIELVITTILIIGVFGGIIGYFAYGYWNEQNSIRDLCKQSPNFYDMNSYRCHHLGVTDNDVQGLAAYNIQKQKQEAATNELFIKEYQAFVSLCQNNSNYQAANFDKCSQATLQHWYWSNNFQRGGDMSYLAKRSATS